MAMMSIRPSLSSGNNSSMRSTMLSKGTHLQTAMQGLLHNSLLTLLLLLHPLNTYICTVCRIVASDLVSYGQGLWESVVRSLYALLSAAVQYICSLAILECRESFRT